MPAGELGECWEGGWSAEALCGPALALVAMETKVQKRETSPSSLMMCQDKREDMRRLEIFNQLGA